MDSMGAWAGGELLGFDLETTGVDRFGDVPVSFALVRVVGGQVVDRLTHLVDPGREIPEGASAVHGISTERARTEGWPLADTVTLLADSMVATSRLGVPVVGVNVCFDLTMLDARCKALDGRGLTERGFTAPVLDALVLDRHYDRFRKGRRTLTDLCAHYGVTVEHAHEAAADAEAAIGLVLAMTAVYPELDSRDLHDLHGAQTAWHQEWASSYDRWRQEKGQPPLDPSDYDWPLPADPLAGLFATGAA